MWVRTQDEDVLIDVNDFSIVVENGIYEIKGNRTMVNTEMEEYWPLGQYKTKEKALEALDALQNRISRFQSVYPMPKDDE